MRALSADWVVPVSSPPFADGAVAWDGGRIVAVGPRADVLTAHPAAEEERLTGCVLAPAFVDLHTHLEYAGYAGFGDGLAFPEWLQDHIARKRALGDGSLPVARLGAAACLRSGIGTVVDAAYDGTAAAACSEAGLRAVVAIEAFCRSDADPAPVLDRLESRVAEARELAGPLVEVGVSPHAPYSVSPAAFEAIVALARRDGLRVVTHLAESPAEVAWARDGSGPLVGMVDPPGRSTVLQAVERGWLGPETVVAHAVQVGPAEIAALAASGASVAHCPRSNALLGCGVAPLRALREAGVPVGLGTDSPASALTFDAFAEMRSALEHARAREQDPTALGAAAALDLATRASARALGRDDLGVLEPGACADVIGVRLDASPFWPCDDPVAALVLGGSPADVVVTVVDGSLRYRCTEDGYARALESAQAARRRMLLPD